MSVRLRVFVSSVQRELESERLILQNLMSTDAFLSVYCEPVLFELEPASPTRALEGCITSLDSCQVYMVIVGTAYGTRVGDISITHSEYRHAKEKGLPILVFIKGERTTQREAGTSAFLEEIEADGLKYKRFGTIIELQKEVRAARKIMLEVFADKIIVSSPGFPPAPITVAKLRSGKYRPCSRNPVLAQNLAYFHRIEERGSGFRRMRDRMLDHGLDQPLIATDTGYFQIIFPGPGENIERITVPEKRLIVTPAVEARLNERQRRILRHVLETGSVTRAWCTGEFSVANDTAGRDLKVLTELGLLLSEGKGRAVHYIAPPLEESTDNRPTKDWNRPI